MESPRRTVCATPESLAGQLPGTHSDADDLVQDVLALTESRLASSGWTVNGTGEGGIITPPRGHRVILCTVPAEIVPLVPIHNQRPGRRSRQIANVTVHVQAAARLSTTSSNVLAARARACATIACDCYPQARSSCSLNWDNEPMALSCGRRISSVRAGTKVEHATTRYTHTTASMNPTIKNDATIKAAQRFG